MSAPRLCIAARGAALAMLLAAGVLLGACARLPAPAAVPTPPAPAPSPAAPTPSQPQPEPPVPPEIPAPPGEPWITVGLAWDLKGVTLDPQGPEGPAVVVWAHRRALEAGEQLTVNLERGVAVVRAVAGRVHWTSTIEAGETLSVTPESGAAIRWNAQRWRGQFRVFINPRGTLTLTTRLPLESYLAGVVPGEIGPLADEAIEAGRAQAIAARSYTLFYRGRRAAEGFDLYGTVEDQLYGSVENERPLASRCVESTAGQVALSDGAPIRANYCSTCGGITADVWEAWPADPLPYLVGGRDQDQDTGAPADDYCAASRYFRWSEEWPVAEFMSNLAQYGPMNGVPLPSGGLGQLVDVRVEARSRSGRVWRLVVETSTGQLVVPAWSLRQVLRRPGNGSAILRSNLFKVSVRRDPRNERPVAVVANGAGSGHGVGLCQTGALGMARSGRTAEQILRHYYRGVEIKRVY